MPTGVIFTAFDDKQGPIIAHATGIGQHEAQQIAIQALVSMLGLTTRKEKHVDRQGILPFHELDSVGFVYCFDLDDPKARGGVRSAAIIIVTELDNQWGLYRQAHVLSYLAQQASLSRRESYDHPIVSANLRGIVEHLAHRLQLAQPIA